MLNSIPLREVENNNPSLIKINADIDTKKRICFHWCSFIIITLTFYFSLLGLPQPFQSVGMQPCILSQNVTFLNYSCSTALRKPFSTYPKDVFLMTNIVDKNIFLLLSFNFRIYSPGQIQSKINVTYDLYLYAVTLQGQDILPTQQLLNSTHNTIVTCQSGDTDYLDCYQPLVYQPNVADYSNYLVMIDASATGGLDKFSHAFFTATVVNDKFTSALLIIRYTFLAVSMNTLLVYWRRLRQIKKQGWVIEQKMVLILSILLPMFNDPFYAATVLVPNRVTAVIGIIFVSDFVCFMTLMLLVQFHRIIHENGEKETKAVNWLKLAICLLMWIFMVASYIMNEFRFFNDPSNTYDDYNGTSFMALKIVYFIIGASILAYIIYYYVQFCRFYESRLWRYKQIGVFSVYFIISLQLFIFTGSFSLYQFDGSKVLITIAVLNLYVFYQQYLWSPTTEAINEQKSEHQYMLQEVIRSNQSYDQLADDPRDRGFGSHENAEINVDE